MEEATTIAQRAGEPIWMERLIRRSCEIDSTFGSTLRLASFLALAGKANEARSLLAGVPADEGEELYRQLRGILHATSGQADEAMALFDASPGPLDENRPAPIALLAAQSMMERCDIVETNALVGKLAQRYPSHLRVRALSLRCRLFLGDYDGARQLLEPPEPSLERASLSNRRAFFEAVADALEFFGWSSRLFDFTRDKIVQDPTHWNLYGRAATAARVTSRDKEYAELVAAIPHAARDSAEGLAVLCHWLADENRIDEASRALDKMRPLAAGWFLDARLYLSLHTQGQRRLEEILAAHAKCGVSLLNPAIACGIYRYYHDCSVDRLRECLEELKKFDRSAPANVNYWQIYLRCLIAVGETHTAEEFYRALPSGLAKCAALAPFGMFFEATQGQHDRARKSWLDYIRTTHHRCVNAPSSYPKTVALKFTEKPGAVLLFVTLFNGADYIDWFLAYYRALGVDHFFVTDNGSTDGSLERLCAQADVSVFFNPESFAASGFGILWVNHLMQRFGVGHWCFHVDLDEGFVFPGCDAGRTLHNLLSYCDDHGFCAVPAIELDMYPERLDGDAERDVFAASCYFDTDYEFIRCELPPYVMIQGGLRQRLTGVAVLMQKSPLVRVASDVRYIECNHGTTHLPVADLSGALLHYKFAGDMKRRIEEAISRAEHFASAIFYRRLNSAVTSLGWNGSLLSKYSRRYAGSGSLLEVGLIKSSAPWEAYRQH